LLDKIVKIIFGVLVSNTKTIHGTFMQLNDKETKSTLLSFEHDLNTLCSIVQLLLLLLLYISSKIEFF